MTFALRAAKLAQGDADMGIFREAAEAGGFAALGRAAAPHGGKLGAVAYAYLTLFGIFHDIALEWRTGLNPFTFYGAEDFFLAGARHPGGVLLAIAVPLALAATGYLVVVFCALMARVAGWLIWRKIAVYPAVEVAGMTSLFGRTFGAVAMLASAFFLVAYLLVVPYASVVWVDSGDCARPMSLVLKPEGDEDPRRMEALILSSADKLVILREKAGETYRALALDDIVSISTPANAPPLSKWCVVLN